MFQLKNINNLFQHKDLRNLRKSAIKVFLRQLISIIRQFRTQISIKFAEWLTFVLNSYHPTNYRSNNIKKLLPLMPHKSHFWVVKFYIANHAQAFVRDNKFYVLNRGEDWKKFKALFVEIRKKMFCIVSGAQYWRKWESGRSASQFNWRAVGRATPRCVVEMHIDYVLTEIIF